MNNLERMRVTLSIQKPKQNKVLRHNVDLYNDNMVEKLVRKTAERIEIGTTIVRETLQNLTNELEQYRIDELAREQQEEQLQIKVLNTKERQAATKFLKSKDLLQKTNKLIGASGVIGEEVDRLLMYLIFTSRKTNNSSHCISLSSSGGGSALALSGWTSDFY